MKIGKTIELVGEFNDGVLHIGVIRDNQYEAMSAILIAGQNEEEQEKEAVRIFNDLERAIIQILQQPL
jgi:hypothetical protein